MPQTVLRTDAIGSDAACPFARPASRVASRAAATVAAAALAAPLAAAPLPQPIADAVDVRSIGPAVMGGRITSIAVHEQDPNVWYAATASGGLLKTVNDGLDWTRHFGDQDTVSIGAVAVASTDPDLVWVGTGEDNPRNSVSWGDGVYKSTDGGASFTRMGLEDSFQIGDIVIHPEDHDTVFVAALGRLWGPNDERGLYRTTDGGENWEQVLFVDEDTGVIDIAMDPADPDELLVATYTRRRDMFDTNDPAMKFGEGAGIWRSTDGGDTFERLTDGLPTVEMGRIALDHWRADSDVIFALVETELIGTEPDDAPYFGVRGTDAEVGARLTNIVEDGPAAQAGLRDGDVVIAVGGTKVASYGEMLAAVRSYKAETTVAIEYVRDRGFEETDVTFSRRPQSEEDAELDVEQQRRRSPFGTRLGGQRANVQEQQGDDGHEHGGLFVSEDGGDTWTRVNSLNPRPMYFSEMRVDPQDRSYIYIGGIQLHRSSDGGETFTSDGHGRDVHVDHHALWVDHRDGRHIRLGNDGGIYVTRDRMASWDHLNTFVATQFYHLTVDHREDYRVYGGLQDNGSWGGPTRSQDGRGILNEDWFRVGGGDGFICLTDPEDPDLVYFESQNGAIQRINLRTGDRGFLRPRPARGETYRWNWRTPFILSHHNHRIYYTAGNRVFRSLDRGDDLVPISPDVTHTDRGSATALAESPFDPDHLWVGSDDGALWMTNDGGDTWIDLFDPEASGEEAAEDDGAADDDAERTDRPARGGRGGGGAMAGRGGRGARMLQRLVDADADGDGVIEADEIPGPMRGFVARIDANEDGGIDRDELKAVAERFGVDLPAVPAASETDAEAETEDPETDEASDEPAAESESSATDPRFAAIVGTWNAQAAGDGVGPGEGRFSLVFAVEDGALVGSIDSQVGQGPLRAIAWSPESGRLRFEYVAEGTPFELAFSATLDETGLSGTLGDPSGAFALEWEARREGGAAAAAVAGAPEGGDEADDADDEDGPRGIAALVPTRMYVSAIEPSAFDRDRVYLAFDGHRSNVDEPFLFASDDRGMTWTSLRGDLPDGAGSVRCLEEDLENPDVLWLGTEFGAWVSIDRGAHWRTLGDLPTVAVHAIAQHHSRGEIALGTHGRGAWIADVSWVRQVTPEVLASDVFLFEPNRSIYWKNEPGRQTTNRAFRGEDPTSSAEIRFHLGERAGDVRLEIRDAAGRLVRRLDAPSDEGVHVVRWDRRAEPPTNRRGRRARFGPRVAPGTYGVILEVDGVRHARTIEVVGDPDHPDIVLWGEAYDATRAIEAMFEEEEDDGDDRAGAGRVD